MLVPREHHRAGVPVGLCWVAAGISCLRTLAGVRVRVKAARYPISLPVALWQLVCTVRVKTARCPISLSLALWYLVCTGVLSVGSIYRHSWR